MYATQMNQLMLDFAGKVHGNCMDHCLDEDQSVYDRHDYVRELLIKECCSLALHASREQKHANRFNTHVIPLRVRIERSRARR